MTTFMPAPPAATCLAFYPRDNNILAIGMDDSTIVIYHARMDEVSRYPFSWHMPPPNQQKHLMFVVLYLYKIITNLEGHKERVTGLAFSDTLNVLVSSGGDAQVSIRR